MHTAKDPTIFNMIRLVTGMNDSLTKGLMFQVYFFYCFNFFFLSFYNFTKISALGLQEIIKKKEIMLGTSDSWSMSRLSHQPREPGFYIEDCRILSFTLCFG